MFSRVYKVALHCNDIEQIIVISSGETLTPGMNQLCNNIMGHLNTKGLYPVLKVQL